MTEAPPSGSRAPRCARLALGCLIAVVALGVGLRFNNLGGKPYWFDEVVTSLRVSGLWEEDVYQELGQRPRLFKAGDFQRYQSPQPGTTWRRVERSRFPLRLLAGQGALRLLLDRLDRARAVRLFSL